MTLADCREVLVDPPMAPGVVHSLKLRSDYAVASSLSLARERKGSSMPTNTILAIGFTLSLIFPAVLSTLVPVIARSIIADMLYHEASLLMLLFERIMVLTGLVPRELSSPLPPWLAYVELLMWGHIALNEYIHKRRVVYPLRFLRLVRAFCSIVLLTMGLFQALLSCFHFDGPSEIRRGGSGRDVRAREVAGYVGIWASVIVSLVGILGNFVTFWRLRRHPPVARV